MSNKTLRVDFTTSEHSPFGRAIGRAMYHNTALFSIVRADYCPHTGGQHRLVVKATLPDLLAYFEVLEEELGKFAEIQLAGTIVDYMIRKQIPIEVGDRLFVNRVKHAIRMAIMSTFDDYQKKTNVICGNNAILRALGEILQPGLIREPLLLNTAGVVLKHAEDAAVLLNECLSVNLEVVGDCSE